MAIRRRVGIIGAGMAGLTLARALSGIADVRIFEKSRGVGGRMATRRTDTASFDHGAQYFTVRDDRFREAVAQADGVVQPWAASVMSLSETPVTQRDGAETVRYVGTPAMNALPKAMAAGLDIQLNTTVTAITGTPGQWFLTIGDSTEGPFDWIVAAAPAPQSAMLLPKDFTHHDALAGVRMNACFTLMLKLAPDAPQPFAAARTGDPVIGWISFNNSKPGRAAEPCLVANATAAWADENLDVPLEEIRQKMLDALRRHVPISAAEADAAMIHRWKYANVERPAGQPFLLDGAAQLAACGDWCIAGRVEAAFVSATQLGDALAQILKDAP